MSVGYRNSEYDISATLTKEDIQIRFVTKTFGWMAFALAITGLVAFLCGTNPAIIKFFMTHRWFFYGLIIGEFLIVIGLAGMIDKMAAATATAVFIGYAALNGVTLSLIFVIYTTSTITAAFFVTAGTFGAMCLYGYFTKRDLTAIGSLCYMALVGLIIASVVNIFLANNALFWIINYVGVLIFVGITAYDTQKIKEMSDVETQGFEVARKTAILGALALYLDFINLLLLILRIMGGNRR